MKRILIRRDLLKMKGYMPGEQPAGNVIKLNTNENPYPPSPLVRKVIKKIDISLLRRYPDPFSNELREKLGKIYGFDKECVFVGNGSDEILALCTRAFVEDNGAIGWFEPSYSLYPVLARIRGVKSVSIKLGKEFSWPFDRYGYTEDDYNIAINTDLFFITNPNAPTGLMYNFEDISAFCKQHRGVVVIDEAYVDFAEYNCLELARTLPNVIVVRTFSKSFSLAGLRVGYCFGHTSLIKALFKIKDSYNVNTLSQIIASVALDDIDYMHRNVEKIKSLRQRFIEWLDDNGFKTIPSSSNFVFTKPPRGFKAAEIYEKLKRNNIFIRYFPGKLTGEYLRITIGTPDQMRKVTEVLSRIVSKFY